MNHVKTYPGETEVMNESGMFGREGEAVWRGSLMALRSWRECGSHHAFGEKNLLFQILFSAETFQAQFGLCHGVSTRAALI